MTVTSLILAAMVAATALATTTADHKSIVVGVHYQSTTDEAIKFVTRQLYPAFLTLNRQDSHLIGPRPKRIVLDMVPYEDITANTFMTHEQRMDLVQGRRQSPYALLTSKVHACAIASMRDDWTQLSYLACVMQEGYEKSSECAVQTCFDDSLMVSCVNSVDGDLLMTSNVNRTLAIPGITAPRYSLTPIVTLDGVYKHEEQYMARLNLLALLCDKYPGRFEDYCDVERARRTMAHNNFGTGYYYPEKRRCSFP